VAAAPQRVGDGEVTAVDLDADEIQADDLFSGAGGWDVACQMLGIHARGVEIMTAARATRDAAGLFTAHDDVWTFDPLHVTAVMGGPPRPATMQIASPPCQTFSQAGKGHGRKALAAVIALVLDVQNMTLAELKEAAGALSDGADLESDERTALVLTPLWFLLHHDHYDTAAWEQVPAVLPVWEACALVLREHGWNVWTGMLHAEQYGVPQTRKRAFLLASRRHVVHPPRPTHSRYHSRTPKRLDDGVAKWVSMAEALGWSPRPGVARVEIRRGHERIHEGFDPAVAPAQAVTSRVDRWQITHTADEPCNCPVAFTATNPRPNAAHRTPCEPAPTMAFGHERPRWNAREEVDETWLVAGGVRGDGTPRHESHPAPTLTGVGAAAWIASTDDYVGTDKPDPRETTPDGEPRFAQQSDNPIDFEWPDNRPATVVAGRGLVQAPGATANRFNDSTKSRNDGVRVSVAEAGILQSFPADHPWQGNKGEQYLQAGNAVPPLLALAALSAALGRPYVYPGEHAAVDESEQPALDLFADLENVAVLHTGQNSATVRQGPKRDAMAAAGRWREIYKPHTRPVDRPAPTITSQTHSWVVRSA
jgi:DNA (cytosine-5)-methyltransferase 1